MGLRGPKPKSASWHLARGTYRPDRHGPKPAAVKPPELVYSRPKDGELNDDQRALLKMRPKRLSQRQKLHFRRVVLDGPWLAPTDLDLLLVFVRAADLYRTAGEALDRCMRDPQFGNPASTVAKTAVMYNRQVHQQAGIMLNVGHKLGMSPAARVSLRIETARKPPASEAGDPWRELRLVRKD